MPANSFSGTRAVVALVEALSSWDFDRTVTYAEVLAVPSGGTLLQLPDNPRDGDFYEWANPDNTASSGDPIEIALSAAAIADGVTIQGATSQVFTAPGTCGKVVFFDKANTWQLELYVQGGSTPSGGEGGELVWRPGATPSPGIVATWAQVAAAIAASPVPLTVYVDSSSATANVMGAVTDCKGTTTFASYNATLGITDTMTINDGATLHRPRAFTDLLIVNCAAVTTQALSFTTTALQFDRFYVSRGATLQLGGAAAVPACIVPTGGFLSLQTDSNAVLSTAADGAEPLFSLLGTATLDWFAIEELTTAGSNVITGAGGATLNFVHDSTIPLPGFVAWGFAGTVNETRLSLAAWAQPASGATGARPAGVNVKTGQIYFDTTLGQLIVWNGAAWVTPNTTAGVVSVIRFAITNAASQASASSIPAGAIVLRAFIDVAVGYSGGATISLGTAASAALFMATGDSTPQNVNLYDAPQDTLVAASNPLLVTIAGAPAAGSGFACVEYCQPLS